MIPSRCGKEWPDSHCILFRNQSFLQVELSLIQNVFFWRKKVNDKFVHYNSRNYNYISFPPSPPPPREICCFLSWHITETKKTSRGKSRQFEPGSLKMPSTENLDIQTSHEKHRVQMSPALRTEQLCSATTWNGTPRGDDDFGLRLEPRELLSASTVLCAGALLGGSESAVASAHSTEAGGCCTSGLFFLCVYVCTRVHVCLRVF